MKSFGLPRQMIAALFSTFFSSSQSEQTKNNDTEHSYEHAHELGTQHHMNARLQVPEELGYFSGETLVDVGCGSGRFLKYFKCEKNIGFCVGLDLSKGAVYATKRKLQKEGVDAHLIICDAQRMPFANNTFDIAFSTDMIEHLPSTPKGVKDIVRVSKDKVVICAPNKLNPVDMSRIAEIFGAHVPPEIEEYVTRFQLDKMLQNSGINKETVVLTERSFLPIGWLFVNKKTLLPMSLVKLSVFVEGFLEKTPLIRHAAGVVVSCSRKASSWNHQKQVCD
jgi:ubiquinone/menaquinone biosynthesis C-methylase UbiE